MKTKTILLAVFITLLLVFSGCSEKAEMPYNANNEGIKPLTTGDFEEGQIVYIKFYIDGESLSDNIDDYVPLNPGLGHFIEFIIEGIEGGYVTFTSEQSKKAYLNNLHASLKMINNEAYTGAIKHIENFLTRFIDVIEEPLRSPVEVFLNLTTTMLKNPNDEYYFNENLTWGIIVVIFTPYTFCYYLAYNPFCWWSPQYPDSFHCCEYWYCY